MRDRYREICDAFRREVQEALEYRLQEQVRKKGEKEGRP